MPKNSKSPVNAIEDRQTIIYPIPELRLAKKPTLKGVTGDQLISDYGAMNFASRYPFLLV